MVDIEKQIEYWRSGAAEDRDVARQLISGGRRRYGLFFAHLMLEKALKSIICAKTEDIAPRLHNLVALAEMAGLSPNSEQLRLFRIMNSFQIQGRYPDAPDADPGEEETALYMKDAEDVLQWLMNP